MVSKSNSDNVARTQFSELRFGSLNPTRTQLEPNEPSSWLVSINRTDLLRNILPLRPAIHLSRNMEKWVQKTRSVQRGISRDLCQVSFCIFRFSHFVPGSAFMRKQKGFRGLFFCGINKTQNSPGVRKVYSECFAFRGVFLENIRKIHAKYDKCIADLRKKL